MFLSLKGYMPVIWSFLFAIISLSDRRRILFCFFFILLDCFGILFLRQLSIADVLLVIFVFLSISVLNSIFIIWRYFWSFAFFLRWLNCFWCYWERLRLVLFLLFSILLPLLHGLRGVEHVLPDSSVWIRILHYI